MKGLRNAPPLFVANAGFLEEDLAGILRLLAILYNCNCAGVLLRALENQNLKRMIFRI